MVVREELVTSAVSFLQDPSVATAPVEQRIAFLRSKNLTQEEIDLSLQRAGSEPSQTSVQQQQQQPQPYYQPQPPYRNAPPPPPQYWPQQQMPPMPPPELPRRDWRDYFIMATVASGLTLGIYTLTRRYITPLIAPPTPPQLTQDKASIDASFDKAFALLDQLTTDTSALKSAEEARTSRLDAALADVESVLGALKDASRRRDDEARRLAEEVRTLKEALPRALDGAKEASDSRLKELGAEMKSLKTLVANRVAAPASAGSASGTFARAPAAAAAAAVPQSFQQQQQQHQSQQAQSPVSTSPPLPPAAQQQDAASTSSVDTSSAQPAPAATPLAGSPYSRMMNGRAAIPAWQMGAASRKAQDAKEKSGTVEGAAGAGSVDGVAGAGASA